MREPGANERCIERVKCPLCKAKKKEPCIYMPVKVLPLYARSPKTLARQALTGTPTKVPHNDRRNALWQLENREMWERIRVERGELLAEAESTHEARAAYATGVRQETQELFDWLRQHGRILWS